MNCTDLKFDPDFGHTIETIRYDTVSLKCIDEIEKYLNIEVEFKVRMTIEHNEVYNPIQVANKIITKCPAVFIESQILKYMPKGILQYDVLVSF
ncbi:MAG: hypothetical protein ACOCRK_02085 [bacterium]